MPAARDEIPRSDMTADQRRRIGALQVAKVILQGASYNPPALEGHRVEQLLDLAEFVATGNRSG